MIGVKTRSRKSSAKATPTRVLFSKNDANSKNSSPMASKIAKKITLSSEDEDKLPKKKIGKNLEAVNGQENLSFVENSEISSKRI